MKEVYITFDVDPTFIKFKKLNLFITPQLEYEDDNSVTDIHRKAHPHIPGYTYNLLGFMTCLLLGKCNYTCKWDRTQKLNLCW